MKNFRQKAQDEDTNSFHKYKNYFNKYINWSLKKIVLLVLIWKTREKYALCVLVWKTRDDTDFSYSQGLVVQHCGGGHKTRRGLLEAERGPA